MILRTRPAASSAARPVSPLPALLLTIVNSLAPCAISASISSFGKPAVPKPPIITVAPSGTSRNAASTDEWILSIIVMVSWSDLGGAGAARRETRNKRFQQALRIRLRRALPAPPGKGGRRPQGAGL